ncbi:hypothetical protein SAMN05444274_10992 [Mariniphaga anaerophila]|uniref:Uncharacterized protein n=1 Tax=Mariniphaga anaerophila TaxID=1484053 RepID=A0A1M5ELX3_9BACT|nr:hypothetical protein [Mariniphaga anaerophila]SHF80303.1 hypothetical protein SAMN05444274_10992 [Mariniphaga anaerophila]
MKITVYIFLALVILIINFCSASNDVDSIPDIEEGLAMETYPNPDIENNPIVDYSKWKIKNGKFYMNGKWKFLKIAKPLRNFANQGEVDKLIADLDTLRSKFYNTIEINCYWHHFDTNGDGEIDKSLAPLNNLINAIYQRGMYPCLSVETYSVGGGQIPSGFWDIYPDACAIDDKGQEVRDTEYGFNNAVVSIFHKGYRETTRKFIKNLASGIDTKKILYFETTVEPQYMGDVRLCYSEAAKTAYVNWRKANNITDQASEMPTGFPVSSKFVNNSIWNKFRAQFLAKWVNGDAQAYREIAGASAYVAVDYLDASEEVQKFRDGDPIEFLTHLTSVNIIQVNWHWHLGNNAPNQKAYDRVWQVKNNEGKDWAITEHMTLNGSDFLSHSDSGIEKILENALKQGTRFGFEFTNVINNSNSTFGLYNNDWEPKNVIRIVDQYWGWWLYRANTIEKEN